MSALPKGLAEPLSVRTAALVSALRPAPGPVACWRIVVDDGTFEDVDAAVLTCPVPQSFSVMIDSGIEIPGELRATEYDRTLALLTVLDAEGAVPAPGGVQEP